MELRPLNDNVNNDQWFETDDETLRQARADVDLSLAAAEKFSNDSTKAPEISSFSLTVKRRFRLASTFDQE